MSICGFFVDMGVGRGKINLRVQDGWEFRPADKNITQVLLLVKIEFIISDITIINGWEKKMDTAKIRALLTAADLGSISKAAEALGYTQSGVTHIIRSLEEEAGFPLLLRGNRGVRLTTDGERLAPLFRELSQAADRLEQELALTRGLERGRVKIGTYSSISLHWMPQILEAFQERYPSIEVELLEGNAEEIEDWLHAGRIDIAYASLRADFSFDTVKLIDDPMYAVLPRSHPRAKDESFPVTAFKGEPFLAYVSDTRPEKDLAEAMELAGISANAKFASNFDMTILAMVEHNLGITIMPGLILAGSNADVAAVPLSPTLSRSLGMAVRSLADAWPAMRRFMSCTMEALKIGRSEA